MPHRCIGHIHIAIVSALPPLQGYTHLLTIVDCFTRWPEAIPLKETDAETYARALVLHWISRFGMPLDLTSDRGSQFTSKFMVHHNGTSWNQFAPHNCIPSSGKWFGGTISLTLENCPPSTTYLLQLVRCTTMGIAGYPYSPTEDLKCSSAEVVFGAPSQSQVTSLLLLQTTKRQLTYYHIFKTQ